MTWIQTVSYMESYCAVRLGLLSSVLMYMCNQDAQITTRGSSSS